MGVCLGVPNSGRKRVLLFNIVEEAHEHLAMLRAVRAKPELQAGGEALNAAIAEYMSFLENYAIGESTVANASLAVKWVWHVVRLLSS